MAESLLIEARNRTVAIENGVIVEPAGRFETVLRFPDADVRPGLVNGHEHLHRNHYGRLGQPPYADAYEWAADIRRRHAREIAAGRGMRRRDALLLGAWRNLFAGVTTVVHHDRWEPDFDDGFPLRVLRLRCADSLGMTPALEGIDPAELGSVHLAEGLGARAADEVRELDARGLLGPNLLAVHGVGMDRDGIDRFRASGAALVWCPSSNLFLFGRTAPRALLDSVDVLLGSDSLLTGAGTVLDELRAARATGLLDDERLEHAVGEVARRRLGLPPARLDPGEPADLMVLSRPLLEASAEDVQLVVAEGAVRVASQDLGPDGRFASVAGVTRWIGPLSGESPQAMNHRPAQADLPD